MNKIFIYGIFDPRTGDCFYIGKTNDMKRRSVEHMYYEKNYNKSKTINRILDCGLKPHFGILLEIDDYYDEILRCNVWEYYEKYFIEYTRNVLNEPITNILTGGNGGYSHHEKPIKQFTLGGEYVAIHKSIKSVARELKVNYTNIIANCKGRQKYAYDYQWCYVGEEHRIKDVKKRIPKRVKQYSKDGNHIKTYASVKEAAKELNCKTNNIRQAVNNEVTISYGYQWCYEGDEENIISNYNRQKRVKQYSKDGKYIKTYASVKEAAKEINGNKESISMENSIRNVANNNVKVIIGYGYQWCYEGDEESIINNYKRKGERRL